MFYFTYFSPSALSLCTSRLMLLAFLVLQCLDLSAQYEPRPWHDSFEQFADAEDYTDEQLEQLYEALCELEQHPINLNTATPDDLRQLVFLNHYQIHDLYEYIDRYRPVRTLGELLMVPSIERRHFHLLCPFVYAGQSESSSDTLTISNLLDRTNHELTAALRMPLYERKGDRNGYLGYKYKHWLRFDSRSSNRLRFGIVASQDAGEPFFSPPSNLGYDYYSFYFQLHNYKRLRNLVVGRYRLSIGKGLVVNTNLSFGKSSMLNGQMSMHNRLRPHSSRSESNYFQGAAAEIAISSKITATAFASYRAIDATLNDDGTIVTILTSGYHRTPSESERRHNAHSATFGSAVTYSTPYVQIGAAAIHTILNRPLSTSGQPLYRLHSPSGRAFTNASLYYLYHRSRFSFGGETAVSGNGAIATLNTLTLRLSTSLSLFALQRFYSYRYAALHANSLSDGGNVSNESGFLAGATWSPSGRLSVTAYSDIAYFPWPRYLVSQSSLSLDNTLNATFTNNDWTLSARYRMRTKERDNKEKTGLLWFTTHSARLAAHYNNGSVSTKTRIYFSAARSANSSFGYMFSQSVGYNNKILSAELSAGIFHTDDYSSRIYASERSMLYTMSSLVCQGYGMRYSLFARVRLSERLMILAKAATTNYFDRSTIGSGLQEIDGSSATDIDLQLKWKF